ncbi:GNAT family N-acetyltransferase [Alkalihalobacillus sp. LMS6]|uniref:GNAT family N-acetyltransferase n=1 Tax=Alkalihalobacillus sp. LMS6 TaxID=2924034 RepID=UPI0020D016A1|nr:GNAT family N-acetyltransferase [Alkalihalobacillus sp. LMS6]UTR06136.1 GNAT family N-acetyltransferase [Alkalihalobacillus sp. LMS6]
MDIQAITTDSDELAHLKAIYLDSFPPEERLDFEQLLAKQQAGKGRFLGFYKEEALVGMMYYAEYEEILYIFYFAIDSNHQSKGYGKQMLAYMLERFSKHKIILLVEEIDEKADNYAQRVRRKNFYLRNGFAENAQYVVALGNDFEMLHRQGRPAYVSDYEKVQTYYYRDDQ